MATDKETNSRLLRCYGITLSEYNTMLAHQDGKCAICGSTPKSRRLHTDHDHRINKVKITVEPAGSVYGNKAVAFAWYKNKQYMCGGETKQEARQNMRKILLKASVRGIICWPCNRGIRVFNDDPVRLRRTAIYLERFNGEGN